MSIRNDIPAIKQFYSESKVQELLCSTRNFVAFARKHLNEQDGLALIKQELSPVVVPVELEPLMRDLWQTTIHDLKP
jgi:hypothetical protein